MSNHTFKTSCLIWTVTCATLLCFGLSENKMPYTGTHSEYPELPLEPLCPPPGSGPSQPEVQSFTPVETKDLVNPFTGDFNYNIPLLDVGGFPVNLAYNANLTVEEDASCVGLGWSLNIGAINRQVRGLPDDFCGEEITYEQQKKNEINVDISGGAGIEVQGNDLISGDASVSFNNYTGWAAKIGITPTVRLGPVALGVGLEAGNSEGFSFSPKLFSTLQDKDIGSVTPAVGFKYSRLEGLKNVSFGCDLKVGRTLKQIKENKEEADHFTGIGTSIGASFANNAPFYTPAPKIPFSAVAFTGSLKFGQEFQTVHPHYNFAVAVSERKLLYDSVKHQGYGYIYEHNAKDVPQGRFIMDINRENDGLINEYNEYLPVGHNTFDWFSVTGQGISGQYRPFRNDRMLVMDPVSKSQVQSTGSAGLEGGIGSYFKVGADVTVTTGNSEYRPWDRNNEMCSVFQQGGNGSATEVGFDPVYFKELGELTAMSSKDESDFKLLGEFAPARVKVEEGKAFSTLQVECARELVSKEGSQLHGPSNKGSNPEVVPRKQLFGYLTAEKAALVGLDKQIKSYKSLAQSRAFLQDTALKESRTNPNKRRKDHLSEICVTNAEGNRYVYGIPVYNNLTIDASFNVSSGNVKTIPNTQLVRYEDGDNVIAGTRHGLDNAYTKTKTPGYAYAYLLSAVVSDDYVDRMGDGPTPDDLGSYTQFKYTRHSENYKWRVPYQENIANYKENTSTMYGPENGDDMANYSYGEKEIWYIRSIETRNFIAAFYFSTRDDGYGVKGENGGISQAAGNSQQKLDSIKLFTKSSIYPGGERDAVPIKKIVFTYDYELCPGVPGNKNNPTVNGTMQEQRTGAMQSFPAAVSDPAHNKGKLTLRALEFLYQTSQKGKYQRYLFNYQNNKPYHPMAFNRWGMYKSPMGGDAFNDNERFPYVPQQKSLADDYATAWTLNSIVLPHGGEIKITYESDDYAYVQYKKAMSMTRVKGFCHLPNCNATSVNGALYTQDGPKRYLYFELPPDIPSGQKQKAVKYMTQGISGLYFSMMTNIGKQNDISILSGEGRTDNYEVIESAVPIPDVLKWDTTIGLSSDSAYGWIDMQAGYDGSYLYHPVSEAAYKFIKESLPQIALSGQPISDNVFANVDAVVNAVANVAENFNKRSYSDLFYDDDRGLRIKPDESFIRLAKFNATKYGGGNRVKKISVNNKWGQMAYNGVSRYDQEYTIDYEYTTLDVNKTAISSGVAEYEPMLGQDENPFYFPYSSIQEHKQKNIWNVEYPSCPYPIGGGYYPSAGVGYSVVKVTSNKTEGPSRSATGYSISEFYTAKDFPTIVLHTKPLTYLSSSNPLRMANAGNNSQRNDFGQVGRSILDNLSNTARDYLTISQGYSIILNNMHGKPKAVKIFRESGEVPYTATHYYYKLNATRENCEPVLDNLASCMTPEGTIAEKYVGITYDIVADAREFFANSITLGLQVNADIFPPAPPPVPFIVAPSAFPIYAQMDRQEHFFTLTKVIYQNALLDSVVVTDMGTSLCTRNLVYDGLTGDLLVSATPNEFGDNYYSTNIPAYWIYKGMEPACQSYNYSIVNLSNDFSGGGISVLNTAIFFPGDEVLLESLSNLPTDAPDRRFWIYRVDMALSKVYLIGRNGDALSERSLSSIRPNKITVLRSARRNYLSASAGNVVTFDNPIDENGKLKFTRVVSASATEYSDRWQTYKTAKVEQPLGECCCMPYTFRNKNLKTEGPTELTGIMTNLLRKCVTLNCTAGDCGLEAVNEGSVLYDLLQTTNISWHGVIEGNRWRGDLSGCNFEMYTNDVEELVSVLEIGEVKIEDAEPRSNCEPVQNRFRFDARVRFRTNEGRETERMVNMFGQSDCFIFKTCEICTSEFPATQSACNIDTGIAINPYIENVRGVYRPLRELYYDTTRDENQPLRYAGFYAAFESCWNMDVSRISTPYNMSKWKWISANNKIDPFGKTVETRDILGVYSSALYGYKNNFMIAEVKNSRYRNMAFENFEDFEYTNRDRYRNECPYPSHWFNKELFGIKIDKQESHTGSSSLMAGAYENLPAVKSSSGFGGTLMPGAVYNLREADYAGVFMPDTGTYYVSVWLKVKRPIDANPEESYRDYQTATVKVNGNTLTQRSNIINGWQQVWGYLPFRSNTQPFSVELIGGRNTTYFDDIRVQPYRSAMKAHVYDPSTLRLVATLDDNNFATLYDYDEEGALERVKRETEKGILTVEETRVGTAKKLNGTE